MAKLDPIAVLKDDHKQVRDDLLDLIDSLKARDAVKSLEILIKLDKLTGPHFRFEEESLYPTLERFFGKEYFEYLLGVHDRIIRTAKELAALLGKGEITEDEAKMLPDLVRSQVLSHPIECEGLTLFAEKLTKDEIDKIAVNLEASQKADLPLLEWAETVRTRRA